MKWEICSWTTSWLHKLCFFSSFCRPEAIYAAVNKRPNTQSYTAGEGKTAWKMPTNATVWFCLMTRKWTHCYDPCYEHTGECWYPFIPTWCSFIPIWSCSLLCVLFAQSTLRSIRTQALSPVTWRSRKVRRSWWPRRKGSGGLGALITELESSPPITSDQKIQTWVHILTINTRYFLSILFCLHPAVRQWFWAEVNVLDRKENPW